MSEIENEKESTDAEMPLVAHLKEFRDRLLRCISVVTVVFLSLIYFANDIYSVAARPLTSVLPDGSSMIATDVTSPFVAPLKLTIYLSLLLSMPFILFQVWKFMAPALYLREKKIAIPLLVSSILLFYWGVLGCYFYLFPAIFEFFTSVAPSSVQIATDISSYLNFILHMSFVFGLAFEVPVVVFLLIFSGIVEADSLRSKRPYVFLGCFVVGMCVTPADPFSQTFVAIPTWLLFEVGLYVGSHVKKSRNP